MLSTIAFIFVLSVLVVVHEFGHFAVAKLLKVRVEVFSVGFGRKILKFKKKETEYRISLVPLGGYVKLAGDSPEEKREGKSYEFLSRSVSERAAIIFAGPVLNYLIAFLLFSVVFFAGVPALTTKIDGALENYPAKKAGLEKGDRVISVDGRKVKYWDELSSIIHNKINSDKMVLEVLRGEKIIEIDLVPNVEETRNILGQNIRVGLIGIKPSNETELLRYGFFKSVYMGADKVFQLTRLTYLGLYSMITGKMSVRESVTGPIGIFYITGEAAKLGFVYLLQLMAALSVSLAIINLFPFPVLDGGHLFFLLLEKIKGRPLSLRTQEIAARVGISILAALMIFVFYNDLIRFGIFEKVIGLFNKK